MKGIIITRQQQSKIPTQQGIKPTRHQAIQFKKTKKNMLEVFFQTVTRTTLCFLFMCQLPFHLKLASGEKVRFTVLTDPGDP